VDVLVWAKIVLENCLDWEASELFGNLFGRGRHSGRCEGARTELSGEMATLQSHQV